MPCYKARESGRAVGGRNARVLTGSLHRNWKNTIEEGACSNKTSRPRTSPRQCTFLRPIDRQSPRATSSTSTPATPPHSRGKATRGFYDATHANRSRLDREAQRASAEGPGRRL